MADKAKHDAEEKWEETKHKADETLTKMQNQAKHGDSAVDDATEKLTETKHRAQEKLSEAKNAVKETFHKD